MQVLLLQIPVQLSSTMSSLVDTADWLHFHSGLLKPYLLSSDYRLTNLKVNQRYHKAFIIICNSLLTSGFNRHGLESMLSSIRNPFNSEGFDLRDSQVRRVEQSHSFITLFTFQQRLDTNNYPPRSVWTLDGRVRAGPHHNEGNEATNDVIRDWST